MGNRADTVGPEATELIEGWRRFQTAEDEVKSWIPSRLGSRRLAPGTGPSVPEASGETPAPGCTWLWSRRVPRAASRLSVGNGSHISRPVHCHVSQPGFSLCSSFPQRLVPSSLLCAPLILCSSSPGSRLHGRPTRAPAWGPKLSRAPGLI